MGILAQSHLEAGLKLMDSSVHHLTSPVGSNGCARKLRSTSSIMSYIRYVHIYITKCFLRIGGYLDFEVTKIIRVALNETDAIV